MNLDTLEDAESDIGVGAGQSLDLLRGVGLDHYEASGLVGERPGKDDSTLCVQRLEVGEVRRTVNAQDDIFHSLLAPATRLGLVEMVNWLPALEASADFMPPADLLLT